MPLFLCKDAYAYEIKCYASGEDDIPSGPHGKPPATTIKAQANVDYISTLNNPVKHAGALVTITRGSATMTYHLTKTSSTNFSQVDAGYGSNWYMHQLKCVSGLENF